MRFIMVPSSYDSFMAILYGKHLDDGRIPCANTTSVATIDFMETFNAYWPLSHHDPKKMAKLGSAAHRLCGLDNVSVPFCMTVEAEVFGSVINFHEGSVKWPSIKEFLIEDPSDLEIPENVMEAGRIPVIVEAIRILKEEFEGVVPVNAYMAPPFTSISSYVVDSISFLKWLRRSPETIHEFCRTTLDTFIEIAKIYGEAGADVITLHEMGASTDIISPKHFNEFVKPYLSEINKRVKKPTVLNICGSTTAILESMIDCGSAAIALGERTPIQSARRIVDNKKPGYPIIGNVPAYEVIHAGTIQTIVEAVRSTIEMGVNMVSPGCDFWLETPTDNIRAFVDAVSKTVKT
jgi:[methyl-Co(III) methanol-specific corrinoid protein]:coenzyme M methyltransferase